MNKILFLFIGLLFSIISLSCATSSDNANVKNVILIYTDELDYNDIGAYGSPFSTPNVDALAENGVTFSNAYTTSPMCTPSRYSVLTGKYPGACTSQSFLKENPGDKPYVIAWNTRIEEKDPTLPKILKKNGFVTGMSGKWHLGIEQGGELPNFAKGESYSNDDSKKKFEEYFNITREKIRKEGGFDDARSGVWTNFDTLPLDEFHFHNFGWITKGGIEFIKDQSASDKPFFLYFAPTAIHGPNHLESLDADQTLTPDGFDPSIKKYIPSSDSLKKIMKNYKTEYAHRFAGIANIDYQVGRLVKTLKEKGLYESTMIIFMADHGIEPGKATTSDRGNKVPFIVSIPNNDNNGNINNSLVQNIDILPTVLDYAGIEDNYESDGISIKSMIEGKESKLRDYIYLESGLCRAVTDGNYKYVAFRYPKSTIENMKNGTINFAPNQLNLLKQQHSSIAIEYFPSYFDQDQLYDLVNDPYELNNIASNNEELVIEYQNIMRNYLDKFHHPFDYEIDPFLETETYKTLVEKTKSIGTEWVPWWKSENYWDYPPKPNNMNKSK